MALLLLAACAVALLVLLKGARTAPRPAPPRTYELVPKGAIPGQRTRARSEAVRR